MDGRGDGRHQAILNCKAQANVVAREDGGRHWAKQDCMADARVQAKVNGDATRGKAELLALRKWSSKFCRRHRANPACID